MRCIRTASVINLAQGLSWHTRREWTALITLIIQTAVVVMTGSSEIRIWGFHYHLPHAIQSRILAFVAMVLFLAAWVCLNLLADLVVVKSPVSNVQNPVVLQRRTLPNFIQQERNSKSLIKFRRNLEKILLMEYPDSLAKAVAIRRWVRQQQSQEKYMWMEVPRTHCEDPHLLLEEQRQGVPGSCRRFSYILLGALLSGGFDARIVCFTSSLHRRLMKSHVAVEVWIEELTHWVLLDPTCDTVVLVDGEVASAFTLREAVVMGKVKRITFERDGGTAAPHPSAENYLRCCRHLFVATCNAVFDGYSVRLVGTRRIRFLHHSWESAYPVFRKQLLLQVGGSALCLSAVFWAWALFSLATK